MSNLPQTNARLTKVGTESLTEDYDDPPVAGDPKWAGDADAYVSERVMTSVASGRLDLMKRTTVYIPGDLRPTFVLQQGDVLTYSYAGQTCVRKVRDYQEHILAGMRHTIRIDVEDV